jgi:DNA-binding NtrC family response regulator
METATTKAILALLIHPPTDSLHALKIALERRFIPAITIRTWRETLGWLSNNPPPHLVFTSTSLPDGTWVDVVDWMVNIPEAVNVIVVSPVADLETYIDVIQRGAFDFVTNSFSALELEHVVCCAAGEAVARHGLRCSRY